MWLKKNLSRDGLTLKQRYVQEKNMSFILALSLTQQRTYGEIMEDVKLNCLLIIYLQKTGSWQEVDAVIEFCEIIVLKWVNC